MNYVDSLIAIKSKLYEPKLTQNPELRKRFAGKPEYVVNFMKFIAEELREYICADSLRFMTEEEMKEATHGVGLCLACFNGEYCTKLFSYQEELDK